MKINKKAAGIWPIFKNQISNKTVLGVFEAFSRNERCHGQKKYYIDITMYAD